MTGIRDTHVLLSKGILCVNVICILLVLNLLSDNFGFIHSSVFHLITIYLLLGLILLNLPLQHTISALTKKNPHQIQLILGILLCLFGFLLLIITTSQLIWVCSIPVLVSGLDLCLQAIDRKRIELHLLAVASFGYGLVYLILQAIPFLWYLYQQSSLLISHAIGMISRTPSLLGPTTSGLNILLVFLPFLISIFLITSRKTSKEILRFSISLGGLFIIWVFYHILLNVLSYGSKDAENLSPLFFILCLIPIFNILLRYRTKETSSEITLPKKRQLKHYLKNGGVWAVGLLFLSTTILTVFINAGAAPSDTQKVLFYGDHMVGTWDIPEYGKYGKDAVGMFGLWPIYLTTVDYKTEILVENKTQFLTMMQTPNQNITLYMNLTDYTTITEIQNITSADLNRASIFVVANLNVSFSKQEQAVIWEYVREGGSLLVIGDHTNVGGIQNPLNELLTPVGIRFRFDAALPFDEKFKWLTCTHLLYQPITFPITSLDELQYGIGASLDISSSSFPIIIGTSALSDEGNQSNGDIAYLGDYEYNKGEQLGDVILVAGAYYGQGKVLVFGDTSSFQNPALPFSYQFVQSSFTWLSCKQTGTTITLQIGISMMLLLGAILVYYVFKDRTLSFALFPFLLCISLLLTASINLVLINTENNDLTGNIVSIDASHNERFTIDSFTETSVNGLILNLQRNNLIPILLREFSQRKIMASNILIINAPTKEFTPEEVTFLQSYMTTGGVVILATGYDDKDASQPLLKAFDVDIGSTPLGPVPYVESNLSLYQNEPRFVDSWPVIFKQNQAISYYNFTWGDLTFHLVVFIKLGDGGLLVISDSQYLLDKNIESIYDYWPGNILFLKYILDELHTMEELQ
jgi:hypothetical protein